MALRARSAAAPQHRLTDVERAERRMTSTELQDLLIRPADREGRGAGLALVLGWETLHVRPGLRSNGRWWTATTGTMSHWPDLTLVRTRDRRLIFAEVKRELEAVRDDQETVLGVLRSLQYPDDIASVGLAIEVRAGQRLMEAYEARLPSIEVFVWRPSDLRDPIETSRIYEVLR